MPDYYNPRNPDDIAGYQWNPGGQKRKAAKQNTGNPYAGWDPATQQRINAYYRTQANSYLGLNPQLDRYYQSRMPQNPRLPGWQPNWLGGGYRNNDPMYTTPYTSMLPGWQPNWLGGGYYTDPMYNRPVTLNPDGTINTGGTVPGYQGAGRQPNSNSDYWQSIAWDPIGGVPVQQGQYLGGRFRGPSQGSAGGASAYIPGVSPEPGQYEKGALAGKEMSPWKAWQANRKRRFQDKYGGGGKGAGISGAGVGSMAVWNP
jgi:hypothetical protein